MKHRFGESKLPLMPEFQVERTSSTETLKNPMRRAVSGSRECTYKERSLVLRQKERNILCGCVPWHVAHLARPPTQLWQRTDLASKWTCVIMIGLHVDLRIHVHVLAIVPQAPLSLFIHLFKKKKKIKKKKEGGREWGRGCFMQINVRTHIS